MTYYPKSYNVMIMYEMIWNFDFKKGMKYQEMA